MNSCSTFGFGKGTVSKCARLKSLTLTPSSVTLLLLVRPPLTFTSTLPRPAARTSVGSAAVPAESERRKRTLGLASGRRSIVCAVMAVPVTALDGLMRVASACTSTVSVTPPTVSATSWRVVSVMRTSTSVTTVFLKFLAVTSTR